MCILVSAAIIFAGVISAIITYMNPEKVFKSETITMPYTVEITNTFTKDGLRTTYLYSIKHAETRDGKKYEINVNNNEIYVNGKPHRNEPILFVHGFYIRTEEPIKELKVNGQTFRPGERIRVVPLTLSLLLVVIGVLALFI